MIPKMDFYLDKIEFSSSPTAKLNTKLLIEKEDTLKKYLRNHPGCYELLQTVVAEGPISVEFCDSSEMMSRASWSAFGRKIRISTEITELFPLLEAFLLKCCRATGRELESTINNLNQFSMFRDFHELYPGADAFADKQAEIEYSILNLTAQIYQTGVDNHKWPPSRTGLLIEKQTFEEYLVALKSPTKLGDGFTRYEKLKKQYLESKLIMVDLNKKRNVVEAQEIQKVLSLETKILLEMKRIVEANRDIVGIKLGEVVYTESERIFQEYELKVEKKQNTLKELKKELDYLADKEKELKQTLEILRVKAVKARPNEMHTITKIEIMGRIISWFKNFSEIEKELNNQQIAHVNEIFIKIQHLMLELEERNALKVDSELKSYETELVKLEDMIRTRQQQSFFNRALACLGFEKTKKICKAK